MILVGRELCFWCVETHRPCEKHAVRREVYTEDSAIRAFSSEDRFEIVEEKELVNLSTFVRYSNGSYWMNPTCSTSHVPNVEFYFPNIPTESESLPSVVSPPETLPKKPKVKKDRQSKLHVNTLKTAPKMTKRGRKVDLARKQFVCDICEVSFTLRQNIQQHLVKYHGASVGVTQGMVADAKKLRYFQWRQLKTMENSLQSGIFSGMLRQIAANAATTIDTQQQKRVSPMVLKASCEEYHKKSQNLETKIQWIKEIKRKNGSEEEITPTNVMATNGGEARKRSRKRSVV